jgi:Fe(3+) dicitrate transport protein
MKLPPLLLMTLALTPAPVAGVAWAQAPQTTAPVAGSQASTEIVVVGEGRNRLEKEGSLAVIDAQSLARSRPLTVNEALRQAPGLFPRDEEGLGLRPNIGVRGLSPTRSSKILQLEDGIPLAYAPYGDNASYSQPPFRRFERIEVLKGASQVRFGPNTVGGVINYITPKPPEAFGGEAMLALGARGYREADIQIGGPLAGDWRAIAHVNLTHFDGVRAATDLATSDAWAKIEGPLGRGQDLSLRVGVAQEGSQITYSGLTTAEFLTDPRSNPFKNDRFDLQRMTAALTHGWRVNPDLTLTTTAYSLWFDRDWWRQSSNSGQRPNDASDPACGGMANLNTSCGNEGRLREYNTYGVESRFAWDGALLGAPATVEGGVRLHKERQVRLQLNGDTPAARRAGVSANAGVIEYNLRYAEARAGFVLARLDFGALSISPGVRVENIAYERVNRITGARGQSDLTETIPSLGFSWRLGEEAVIYGGAHRGFAPPRVEDAITNAGGAVDLDPERSVNLEIGYRGRLPGGAFLDIAYFRMDFDNQLVPASVAGGVGATLTNGGETLHQGLEASLSGEMSLAGGDAVFYRAAATYLPTARFEGRRLSSVAGFTAVSVSGNRLPYAPEWLASAAIGYGFGARGDVQVEIVYTDAMFTDDLNTTPASANGQRGLIPSATTINLAGNWRPFGDGLTLFATVKNLADELIIVDRSRGVLPGAPRMAQAGLIVKF